jgi:peptide/nickel transport system substrate-binding protein
MNRSTLFTLLLGTLWLSMAADSKEDKIVVAIEADTRSLDPRYASDANAQYIIALSQCSLISFDEHGQVIANLATKWRWVDDRTLVFQLNPKAKFANGKPVSSADVKATFDFLKRSDLKQPSPISGDFKNIASILAGTNEITFKFSETDVSFVPNFVIGVLPQDLAALDRSLATAELGNGCGPYQLKSQDLNGIILEANPNYSLASLAKTKRIEFKIVKDEQTRYAKLRKGEIDLIQNSLSRDKIQEIAASHPKLAVYRRPSISTTYLGFNLRDRYLGQKLVRQAINLAINRDEIIKFLLQGYATPAKTMLAPGDPFLLSSLASPTFDPTTAATLLDKAGFTDPDGKGPKPRFQLSYKTTTDTTRLAIAQAIASQLGKVGIRVTVESQEWGKFKDEVERGQVQLWSLSWVGFKDPDIFRHAFASDKVPPNGGNRGWYQNPELDKLLQKARGTPQLDARKNIYADVQKILAEDLPYAFLWHEERFIVAAKSLKGVTVYADGRLDFLNNASW